MAAPVNRESVSCLNMLARHEVFALILGLVEANDWDIFPDVARQHRSDIPSGDAELHETIGTTLQDLIATYDYIESPAFQREVAGKSAQFVDMKTRSESESAKRSQHKKRLLLALAELPVTDSAFDLVTISRHAQLRKIQDAIAALSSPAAN